MGMYDSVKCKYPLPVEGTQDHVYQTKDTPAQFCDLYKILEDGSLWHEEYDTEDRSDPNAPAGSLESVKGCMTRVNKRLVHEPMTGELRIYDFKYDGDINAKDLGWIEYSLYFKDGFLQQLNVIENRDK